MNRNTFNLQLNCLLAAAVLLFFMVATTFVVPPTSIHPLLIFLIVIGGVFFFLWLMRVATNPLLQLTALCGVVCLLGVSSSNYIQQLEPHVLKDAFLLTVLSFVIVSVVSFSYPQFFERIQSALLVALIALIIVSLIATFWFKQDFTLMHIAFLVVFIGLLGGAVVRSRKVEPTFQNAIISCADIFIDLLNIFMRFTHLLSNRE